VWTFSNLMYIGAVTRGRLGWGNVAVKS
jgi:hypothetical protein